MTDSKDTKKELETGSGSKLPPTQCKECETKLVPRAKFCAMCGWKVPLPPPPSLAEVLSTKFETTRLIYDAKALRGAKWTDKISNMASRAENAELRTNSYWYNICNLITPQPALPNLAKCVETQAWTTDGTLPDYTWESLHKLRYFTDGHPPYASSLTPWEQCSIPLLKFAGVTHMCRPLVSVASQKSKTNPDIFGNVLAEMVKHKIHAPRCGFAFEVKSSLPWDKMTDWYSGTHPKTHEYTMDTPVTITFEECDEKYYELRAGVVYDLGKAAGSQPARSADDLKTYLANAKQTLIAEHAEFTHAQNVLDDLLAKLPELVYMYNRDGKPTFLTEKELLKLTDPFSGCMKSITSLFNPHVIAKTHIRVAKPELDTILSTIADADKLQAAIRRLPLKEGIMYDDVTNIIQGGPSAV